MLMSLARAGWARTLLAGRSRDDGVAQAPDNGARVGRHCSVRGSHPAAGPPVITQANSREGNREERMRGGADTGTMLSKAIERAVELAVLGGPRGRREFIERVGAATA